MERHTHPRLDVSTISEVIDRSLTQSGESLVNCEVRPSCRYSARRDSRAQMGPHRGRSCVDPAARVPSQNRHAENLQLRQEGGACKWNRGGTPLSRENVWRPRIGPKLESVELGWVDFHVMRRTHATLMREIHDDPKLVADQLGHTIDVNQNVCTRASVAKAEGSGGCVRECPAGDVRP